MFEALINFGANINIQDNEGNTPLHLAVLNHSDLTKSVSTAKFYRSFSFLSMALILT